jgi:hypothetical protein
LHIIFIDPEKFYDKVSRNVMMGFAEAQSLNKVLRRMEVEDDEHESAKVLDGDGLSAKRGGEGLCMGDVLPLHRSWPSRVAP